MLSGVGLPASAGLMSVTGVLKESAVSRRKVGTSICLSDAAGGEADSMLVAASTREEMPEGTAICIGLSGFGMGAIIVGLAGFSGMPALSDILVAA